MEHGREKVDQDLGCHVRTDVTGRVSVKRGQER